MYPNMIMMIIICSCIYLCARNEPLNSHFLQQYKFDQGKSMISLDTNGYTSWEEKKECKLPFIHELSSFMESYLQMLTPMCNFQKLGVS